VRAGRSSLVAAFLVVVAPARARAAACGEPRGAAGGPLAGGTEAADFGAIPETCAGTELALRLRGTALVAPDGPDYYGNISAAATLRLRHQLGHGGRAWLSFAVDAVTYRYVANAVIVGDGFALGPPTVGVHWALGDWARTAAHGYVRALLPLDTARTASVRTGLELGATARRTVGPTERAGLQGGVALLAPLVVVGARRTARSSPWRSSKAGSRPRRAWPSSRACRPASNRRRPRRC